MQIKEIQRHTGITKANIRYYESQGLIYPRREENGYRVYSQADIDGLLRVKLLRALGISIEEIKALQNGITTLETVLSHRRASYADAHAQLVHSENIIKEMLSDGIGYDTLDANVYLEQMNSQPSCLQEDVDTKLNLPWRRFWARSLDFSLYNLILYLLFPSLYAESGLNLLLILGEVLLLLGLEPIMLCLLCTTPGKIVFGITVTNPAGGHLTYAQAVDRTLLVLRHGLGFCLPYLSDYLHYQSLTVAERDGELIWEQDSELNIRDTGIWRYFVFAVCLVLLLAYPAKAEFTRIFSSTDSVYKGEDPFFNTYRVAEVTFCTDEAANVPPVVELTKDTLRFYEEAHTQSNYTAIGAFEYAPPEDDPHAGRWKLQLDGDVYDLRIGTGDEVILEYRRESILQWSCRLERIDTLSVGFKNIVRPKLITCDWFGESTFSNPQILTLEKIEIDSTLTLSFHGTYGDTLTLLEETHNHGEVTVQQITLAATEAGYFSMEISPISDPDVYVVYRIPYENGEYIFGIE